MTGTVRRAGRPRPSGRPRQVRARRGSSRPTRRRALLRRWGALAVPLAIGGLVYALLYTPLLGVREVEVRGAEQLTAEQIRAAAAVQMGKPMLRLDVDSVKARVAALPRVSAVDVSRSWPSTVEVVVTERRPIAFAQRPDGAHLVDPTGVDYAVVPQAPEKLPVIELATIGQADPTTNAVVSVLGAIPSQLREKVVSITAQSPGSVRMTLADGRVVRWGNAQDNDRKAAVLGALLARPGRTYDVASPDLPTIS